MDNGEEEELKTVDMVPLVGLIRQGSREAQDKLIRRCVARLQRMAGAMLYGFPAVRGETEPEDIVQAASMRLLRALKKVQPGSMRDFYGLAAEQIRRELLDLARRRRPPTTGEIPEEAAPSDADMDRWTALHEAIAELPAEQREVVDLVFYHSWTHARIAELFQVDERTIRRHWKAAREALRMKFGGDVPQI